MDDRGGKAFNPSSNPTVIAHVFIANVLIAHVVIMRIARALCGALACSVFLLGAAHAGPSISCKPILSVQETSVLRTSETLPYTWKAIVFADNRHCATQSGMFEIDFLRIKEFGPDVQMTERFRWQAGRFEVSVELWADEAVLEHRIGFIAPCVCREMPFN